MIDINSAIQMSKTMPNISDGGSACFDFEDVVLVKYTLPLKYVKENYRARQGQERVMERINKKVEMGVNTPMQFAMKRVIEKDTDVCYVLQGKCPGVNCANTSQYGASYDQVMRELEIVYNIPYEHYVKLITDGCNLLEMGYEAKNKNLFYDKDSGFWYIDFLDNDKNRIFDSNNPIRIFEAIRYAIPRPRQIASSMRYDTELTDEQQNKYDLLENSIEAKTFLAMKQAIPNLERYEKFFLIKESEKFRKYLMDNNIVKKDLFNLEECDYQIYDELYNIVVNSIVDKIVKDGEPFWSVEVNDIRNDSELFGLLELWEKHKNNPVNREEYEDKYDYEYETRQMFTQEMLDAIVSKLKTMDQNENVKNFLSEMSSKNDSHIKK